MKWIFITMLTLLVPSALACTCTVRSNDITEDDAVFGGAVLSVREKFGLESILEVTFIVEQPYKGVYSKRIVVYTPATEENCGYTFEEGERYVVRASEQQHLLTTTSCSGNMQIDSYPELYIKQVEPTKQQSITLLVATIVFAIALVVIGVIGYRYFYQSKPKRRKK